MAYSPDGARLAVADRGNHRVQLFDAEGNYVKQFGGPGSANGTFNLPTSVAYSPDGSMIAVSDRGNDRVQMFHANGTFAFAFGSRGAGEGQFDLPITAAFVPPARPPPASQPGMIAVADSGNDRIQVFGPNGTFAFEFGEPGSGPGELRSPQSVAYTPDGNIVVADTGNRRIQVFSPAGSPLLEFDYNLYGHFGSARGVDVDRVTGTIAVADATIHRVQLFNPDGTVVRSIGGLGGNYGQFHTPVAVDWSPDGSRLAVAGLGVGRVQIFYANGTVERGFREPGVGDQYAPYSVDWSPDGSRMAVVSSHDSCATVTLNDLSNAVDLRLGCSASSFSAAMSLAGPRSVAWSEDGTRLAVADTGNNRVQVFAVDGTFELTVGASGAAGSGEGEFNRPVSVAYHPPPPP